MDNIQCVVNIDNENKQINLQGLTETDLQIDFNSDVDFTELVSTLTKLIDDSKKIVFTNSETATDEKLTLIIDTISGIIDKYNEAISNDNLPNQDSETEDDNLLF